METKKKHLALQSQGFGDEADRRLLLIQQGRPVNEGTGRNQRSYSSGAEVDRRLLLIKLRKTGKPSKLIQPQEFKALMSKQIVILCFLSPTKRNRQGQPPSQGSQGAGVVSYLLNKPKKKGNQ